MMRGKRTTMMIFAAALALALCFALVGCGSGSASGSASSASAAASGAPAKLGVAYQYGLSYAPAVIAKEQGLVEKYYKEATGNDVTIEWNQMSSGADINIGITSGSIDVGFMGLGPAITGVATGLDYKIFANISGQEHGMTTSDAGITSIKDLVGSDKQIALVNIGSIQHIILAKALADNGLDPHALDSNIVAMKHPDGMAALQSGSIPCHLTSSPYIFTERADSSLHEIEEVTKAWTKDDSFIVGVASSKLHEDAALYQALCDAIAESQEFITANPDEAAAILCEFDGNTAEVEADYLKKGTYSSKTNNLFEMAKFMSENGFIDKSIDSYETLVYDNVEGN